MCLDRGVLDREPIRRRVVAHGRVQGVSFRDGARRTAGRLGLAGWVRNRLVGAVEAELEGDPEAVAAAVGWFGQGPPGARVDGLEVVELPPRAEHGFSVLPTAR